MDDLEIKVKVYKKRWLILSGLILLVFMSAFNLVNFGLVNEIMVVYFNTTYTAVDWMVTGCNVGGLVASPFVAFFSFKRWFSCRKIMIIATMVFVIDYSFVILAFMFPKLFALLPLGQAFGGMALVSVFTLPTSVSQLWFPESEIALATGLAMVGSSCGGMFSYLVIPSILPRPFGRNIEINGTGNKINDSQVLLENMQPILKWQRDNKYVYVALFSVLCFLALVLLILFIFFLPERPNKPPSYAQFLKQSNNEDSGDRSQLTFALFWRESALVLKDYVFLTASIASGISLHLCDLNVVIMEQLVRQNSILTRYLFPNITAGLIMFSYAAGCIIGNITSGMLLDRFKNYYMQICVSALLTLVAAVATLLSVYYLNVSCLFVSKFLVGIFARVSLISLTDSLMQHTYPKDPLFVTSWITFFQTATAIVIVEAGRQIYSAFTSIGALLFICVLGVVTVVFSFLSKIKTNRQSAEENRSEYSETTPFFENTNN